MWEFGINHAVHIPPQVRRWDDVAAALGDPQLSLVLLPEQALQGIAFQSERDDRYEGIRTLQLQPSVQLPDGVYFALNDDVVVYPPDKRDAIGAGQAIEILDGEPPANTRQRRTMLGSNQRPPPCRDRTTLTAEVS